MRKVSFLETIYETDEEIVWQIPSQVDEEVPPKRRLPYYVCWSIIAGFFVVITLIVGFYLVSSHSNRPTDFFSQVKQIAFDFDDSLIFNLRLRSPKEILKNLDHFSDQINDELSLPHDTIRLFTVTVSSHRVDWSRLERENRKIDGAFILYLHLSYPQFCWQNQQCQENFRSHLNDSWTKIGQIIEKQKLDDQQSKTLKIVHCSSISNSTSTTYFGFLSIEDTEMSLLVRHFCELFDYYYLIESFFESNQRHYHLHNPFDASNEINDEIDHGVAYSNFCSVNQIRHENLLTIETS